MTKSPPIIALQSARLGLGGKQLFSDLDLTLGRRERACLVGRNGCGKSSLLRALAGEIELDAGDRVLQVGSRVAYLPQEPDLSTGLSVRDYVAADLDTEKSYRAEIMLDLLALDRNRRLDTLSGGEGRRAALARTLAVEPDVLLLDEPTNHLDLPTIEWLEGVLARFPGALLTVSHDRAFLNRLSRVTYWLDRGQLLRLDGGFAHFDDWAEKLRDSEARALAELGRKIERENHWVRHGITARRKRNQRRLAELNELRAKRAALLSDRPGELSLDVAEARRSGRMVIEAEGIAKSFDDPNGGQRRLVDGFTTRILRGDRVGVIGPNGAGKTTLVQLLLGRIKPERGRVRLGTKLEIAYFDQQRESLDPETSLWKTLAPHSDSVTVGGRQRHVVGYLGDFLFDEDQALQPVKSLSGGERNRLMLARLFARPSNLLVMDEPTNDLDLDSLDLLVEVLANYEGTLILVSHDRDFLDRLVTSVIAVEGTGRVTEYAGGYSDAMAQRGEPIGGSMGFADGKSAEGKRVDRPARTKDRAAKGPLKLGYREERELERLGKDIARLSSEIAKLERALSDPELYTRDTQRFHACTRELAKARHALDRAETRWLELEDLREQLARGATK